MRVVDDHRGRLQFAEIIRDPFWIVADLEQRLPLLHKTPQQERLPGPRRTDEQAVAAAIEQPAHLAFTTQDLVAQDWSARDRELTQRPRPTRHSQEALGPSRISVQLLCEPVLVGDLNESDAEAGRLVPQRVPHARLHAPGSREQRPVHLRATALCTKQIPAQVAGQIGRRGRDEGKRLAAPAVRNRAVESIVLTSANWNEARPDALEDVCGAFFERCRIQLAVQRL